MSLSIYNSFPLAFLLRNDVQLYEKGIDQLLIDCPYA